MFDTNRNGFFDRWEVYLGGDPRPVRVTTVQDERAPGEVLPKAMADRRRLMKAMSDWRPFEIPAGLAAAMETGSENYRRYAMDVACELQYQDFRNGLMKQAEDVFNRLRILSAEHYFMGDLLDIKRSKDKSKDLNTSVNSHTAWRLARALAELDAAYGSGDTDGACSIISAGSDFSAEIEQKTRIGLLPVHERNRRHERRP